MMDALSSNRIILGFGIKNVWHKLLRVTVIQREPGRLDLHHNTVALGKHMVHCWQREMIMLRGIGLYGFRFSKLARYRPRKMSIETGSSYPPILGLSGVAAG